MTTTATSTTRMINSTNMNMVRLPLNEVSVRAS
jgi:hypothetical protein